MNRSERICQRLESLKPIHLELKNESAKHAKHIAMQTEIQPSGETHYKLVIVSEAFEGHMLIARQRKVNDLIKDEFSSGLHALQMKTLTPEEYKKLDSDI